jgi:hypothetical protein
MDMPPITLVRDLSRAQAEILRSLLEAEGVRVMLSQEAAGSVIPVDVGAFGQVDLIVPAEQADLAREILKEALDQPPSPPESG